MTEWKRHGVIFEGVNGRAQCPVVDTNNEDFWRIYFSHRDFFWGELKEFFQIDSKSLCKHPNDSRNHPE